MFDAKQLGAMLGSMQDTIKDLQERNEQTILSAKSGGGLVSVSCNGNGEVIDISIDDSLLEDKESLQILLMSALNDVRKSVEDNRQSSAMNLFNGLGTDLNIFGVKPNC